MDKKGITIVCTLGIILAAICVVFIVVNNMNIQQPSQQQEVVEETDIETETTNRTERSQNVILTSRTGTQVTEMIRYSNKHSAKLIEELDTNGISNKYKILAAFDKIVSKEEYQNLVGYSQTYGNTYVLASNMQIAINSLFEDTEFVNESIQGVLYYDSATDSFAMLTTGVQGYVEEFVVEVPYKITEYTDRIELLAYRLYVKQSIETIEDEQKVVTDIYYDKNETSNALSFTDNSQFYESNQITFLREKIEDSSIADSKMEKVKYTFAKEDGLYKFSTYEKI